MKLAGLSYSSWKKSLPLQCVNIKDILFMKKPHECTKTQYSTRHGGTQQWSPLEPKAWWPSDVVTTCTQGMVALICGHHLYSKHGGIHKWSPLVHKAWCHSDVVTTYTQGMVALKQWSPHVRKAWWHSDVTTTCTQGMVTLSSGHHL